MYIYNTVCVSFVYTIPLINRLSNRQYSGTIEAYAKKESKSGSATLARPICVSASAVGSATTGAKGVGVVGPFPFPPAEVLFPVPLPTDPIVVVVVVVADGDDDDGGANKPKSGGGYAVILEGIPPPPTTVSDVCDLEGLES